MHNAAELVALFIRDRPAALRVLVGQRGTTATFMDPREWVSRSGLEGVGRILDVPGTPAAPTPADCPRPTRPAEPTAGTRRA